MTNAHTHLEISDLGYICPPQPVSFISWGLRLSWAILGRTKQQTWRAVEQGIAELQANGTTQVGDVTDSWLSVEPLLASGLGGVVYLDISGLERGFALRRLEQARTAIRKARAHPHHGRILVGLGLHAPYSCHPDLLRAAAAYCRTEQVPLTIHVAESPAERDLFLRYRGPLSWCHRVLVTTGVSQRLSQRSRVFPFLAALGVLAARPLLVHAIHVTDADIDLIAAAGCAVVHCPRSNALLSCGRMPLERFLARGVPVYLGTDSRASSPDLDVRAEAAFAQQLHGNRVAAPAVQALTQRALILENSLPTSSVIAWKARRADAVSCAAEVCVK